MTAVNPTKEQGGEMETPLVEPPLQYQSAGFYWVEWGDVQNGVRHKYTVSGELVGEETWGTFTT